MTFDLYLFAMAFGGVTVAILVAGWAFQIHKRDFWKIREWATMLKDGKTVESLREQVETLKQDAEQQRREKEQERDRLTAENKIIADASASSREVIRQSEEARKYLDQNQQKIEEAKAIRENWTKVIEESSQLDSRLESLRSERGQLYSDIAELDAKKKFLTEHLGDYDKLKEEKQQEIANLHETKKQIEEQIGKLQDQIKALADEKQKRLAAIESENAERQRLLNEQLDGIRREIQNQESALAKLKQSINEALELLEKVEQEIIAQQKERQKILEELSEARRNLEKMQDEALRAKQERDEAEAKKRVAEKEHGSLVEAIKGSQKTFDEMVKTAKGTVEIRADAFKGLYVPVFAEKTIPTPDSEQSALNRLTNYVAARNFEFPERLLYAFHTALKTSDISCLTVMAGVSGTGKSALPKLYAEAMGMHLCMLSVEPRWDSPRDLFGFFNYMENRYEPTLLARALIQFDPYGDKNDLKDQMLLVLLDEMNLARIEYYFSEYLSKLELRRELLVDIMHGDESARRKVSMELFSGWKPCRKEDRKKSIENEEEPPIHLYAHTNVLFAGTMNEDETTQSLSDKVIDRANVLHFGRPARLQDNRQNGQGRHAVQDSRMFVPAEVWRNEWCRDPAALQLDNYRTRLDSLNEVLGNVNRPFAHRTSKAILAYVANYPLENARERAFADQVAMRIMPKLRGLDLGMYQNELLAVQGQIQQINDTALREAFEHARNNNTHGFFRWQGIDWSK